MLRPLLFIETTLLRRELRLFPVRAVVRREVLREVREFREFERAERDRLSVSLPPRLEDVVVRLTRLVAEPLRVALRDSDRRTRELLGRREPALAAVRRRPVPVRLDLLWALELRRVARVLRAREVVDVLRDDARRLPGCRPAAVSRAINLLKLLFWPPAVVSWCKSARPFSSNERNQSSHEISSSESPPENPGKSSRIMPVSPFLPVPRTHAGRAPRSSAHRRISS
ncbi:MAG: hypothetical protein ACM3JB_14020 [Acidobacteriaceae bacterium]